MSDQTPENPTPPKPPSLFDRALAKAQAAGTQVPNEGELGGLGVAGAVTAGGVAAGVRDATSPASYAFHSARPPEATLRVFTEALNALGDHDTRPQVSLRKDQATVQFQQQLPTGHWVTAVTITLVQASEEVNVSASAPSLAAMGGAAAEVGGAAMGSLGKVFTGNVVGGLVDAAKNVGRLTQSAENLTLSNKIREVLQRIGNQLDDEWNQVQTARKLAEDQALMMATCKFCGAPFPSAEAAQCPVCGAPRVQGKPEGA